MQGGSSEAAANGWKYKFPFSFWQTLLDWSSTAPVKYRSFLERASLSAATINLHLSAIRRLADESAETGWLSPELAIGIRQVKGVERLGRKMGNCSLAIRLKS